MSSSHRQVRELPQVGRIAATLFNIPVMAAALAACYLALWLTQTEAPRAAGGAPSPEAIAVVDPAAADGSASPAR